MNRLVWLQAADETTQRSVVARNAHHIFHETHDFGSFSLHRPFRLRWDEKLNRIVRVYLDNRFGSDVEAWVNKQLGLYHTPDFPTAWLEMKSQQTREFAADADRDYKLAGLETN